MSWLDDMPAEIASGFSDDFYDTTLTRSAVTGGDDWNPSTGTPSTTTDTGKGVVLEFSDYEARTLMVMENERKILLLVDTFKVLAPVENDTVTILGGTYLVVGPVTSDPSRSIYQFRGRLL